MSKSQKTKKFQFGNHSDTGKVRRRNEDYLGYFDTMNGDIFVVCDGMGGHVGGAIASQKAVTSIRHFFQKQYYANPAEAVEQAIKFANEQIFLEAQHDNRQCQYFHPFRGN